MAKLDRDLHQQRVGADLGRARQRKNRRQSGSVGPTQVENVANKRASIPSRPMRRNGPSLRENLVADQIHSQAHPAPSIQEKLSSKLSLGNVLPGGQPAPRKPRRQAMPRQSESRYEASSHAESQRVISQEQNTQPRRSHRVFDAHSESNPPVMVRGGMGGMAFGRVATSRVQKQNPPRRRIDVPLKVTGAEVRLPAIPLVHLGWRAVSFIMVLMMLASLVLMWKGPIFQASGVEAVGLKRLTASDLNAVLGIYGKSIFTLNPNVLHEALSQAFPELSRISVKVGLPAKIKVTVTERVPVIAWTQDGVETWVDAQGISFPPRGTPKNAIVQVEGYGNPPGETQAAAATGQAGSAASVPVPGTPNTPTLRLSPELVSSILALGAKMPEGTVLVYDSQHGLGWNDPNGWEVFFGPEDQDMDMKLVVYQALVERLKNDGIKPALISVEYLHAPYYRMER